MAKKPPLTLVEPALTSGKPVVTSGEPPRKLGEPGRNLWDRITAEYDISDCGGIEMLAQACAGLDRAEALRAQIDADGEVIRSRGGVREHPAIKLELAARAFVVRTLSRLGLNFEPLRAGVGRPPPRGWGP